MADEYDRKNVVIHKEHEKRSKQISKMISEGGLGSDKYYDIEKSSEDEDEQEQSKDDE